MSTDPEIVQGMRAELNDRLPLHAVALGEAAAKWHHRVNVSACHNAQADGGRELVTEIRSILSGIEPDLLILDDLHAMGFRQDVYTPASSIMRFLAGEILLYASRLGGPPEWPQRITARIAGDAGARMEAWYGKERAMRLQARISALLAMST